MDLEVFATGPPEKSAEMLFFFFLNLLGSPHGMWNLSSQSGIKPMPPAVGAWVLTSGPPGKTHEVLIDTWCWQTVT